MRGKLSEADGVGMEAVGGDAGGRFDDDGDRLVLVEGPAAQFPPAAAVRPLIDGDALRPGGVVDAVDGGTGSQLGIGPMGIDRPVSGDRSGEGVGRRFAAFGNGQLQGGFAVDALCQVLVL